jgi:hypothetical protein
MPYHVPVGGVLVQCDTVAEAIELARQAGTEGGGNHQAHHERRGAAANHVPGSRWTEHRIKEFFKLIKPQQRKLVDTLLTTTDGRTDDQLCATLGFDNGRSLAGVFTGIYKNAKKVGADPNDVYNRTTATIGDKRVNEYTLTESFRTAAKSYQH